MNTPKLLLVALLATLCLNYGCSKSSAVDPAPTQPTANYITTNYTKALPNEALTITGSGFSTDLSKLTVKFNNVPATVISATATELNVEVPATAQTGKITVVSDQTNYTTANNFVVLAGTQSTFMAGPLYGTTSDGTGNIYLNGRTSITKVTAAGSSSTFFQDASYSPFSKVTADAAGNVYWVYNKCEIFKISPAGGVSHVAGVDVRTFTWIDGNVQAARFYNIDTLIADASGNLWVSDARRLRKVAPDRSVTTLINSGGNTDLFSYSFADGTATTARMGWMTSMVMDPAGNIYTNDNNCIRKITPAGDVTTIAGNGTQDIVDGRGSVARFGGDGVMAMDARGNIFIADRASATFPNEIFAIRMVNKNGLVSTLIKTLTTRSANAAIVNGSLNTATLNRPTSLTFDAAGNLYVTNNSAGVVSKITFN